MSFINLSSLKPGNQVSISNTKPNIPVKLEHIPQPQPVIQQQQKVRFVENNVIPAPKPIIKEKPVITPSDTIDEVYKKLKVKFI
jgi:hypothetical protein